MRLDDVAQFAALLAKNAPADQILPAFNPVEWLSDKRNIALRIEHDLAMFEYLSPGVYSGHIWFKSRGLKAFRRARAMIDHMGQLGAVRIFGEVPPWRKDVCRFVTGLGFTPLGTAVREGVAVLVYQAVIANNHAARDVA